VKSKDTSSSREESMNKSGEDAFAEKNAAKTPPPTLEKDGTSEPADNTYIGTAGEQFSRSSGTTPLGGESSDQDSRTGPGGVEGERDSR
jgi:hypothetical protein